jgi:hypothetical protein
MTGNPLSTACGIINGIALSAPVRAIVVLLC